jgi:hypothetical protein
MFIEGVLMSEIIIGVLFSAGFSLTYLFVSKWFKTNGRAGYRRSLLSCRSARGAGKSIAARPPQLFMTTGELSEHHSTKTGI